MTKGIMCLTEELEREVFAIEYKGLSWNVVETEFLNANRPTSYEMTSTYVKAN